ncbi:unnamed protein product [Penicillium salamii]|uniref:Uncharacterized protein n=1 Tax=Penicillium salamii TaxID=1612424 RepID=A0A9W4JTD2_9EURO|nr:unnamed protein product [Penicillium salamii]CAG8418695.1 unnamed protein product [Penicillium salamii]CAG8419511.1 unnamed protein product [Penicillium salamii]CAG8555697.1 unnamed protein product [Penicillium salamii]
MEEIADIVRQIGRQQGENLYLRTCYALFKHLQDKAEEAREDLLRLHQSAASASSDDVFSPIYQVAHELRISVHALVNQARHAQLACEEFCQLEPSFSALEAFRFTDTTGTADMPETTAHEICDSPRSMRFIMLPVEIL